MRELPGGSWCFSMASGAGKTAQPPGPGSSVNGTAAEFPTVEPELYDDQMHSKMCKKIAQLTKVRGWCDIREHLHTAVDAEMARDDRWGVGGKNLAGARLSDLRDGQ